MVEKKNTQINRWPILNLYFSAITLLAFDFIIWMQTSASVSLWGAEANINQNGSDQTYCSINLLEFIVRGNVYNLTVNKHFRSVLYVGIVSFGIQIWKALPHTGG